jgi:molecular chaperone IbpA
MATHFDVSPFYRSSIGYDRIFDLLDKANRPQSAKSWPPYDILKIGDDNYRVVITVPGFGEDELTLTYQPNLLIVSGAHAETGEADYLHRGISAPQFEHRFELADYVRVDGAKLDKGMLAIDLVREVPEAMKPRKIAINASSSPSETREKLQIEDRKAA